MFLQVSHFLFLIALIEETHLFIFPMGNVLVQKSQKEKYANTVDQSYIIQSAKPTSFRLTVVVHITVIQIYLEPTFTKDTWMHPSFTKTYSEVLS